MKNRDNIEIVRKENVFKDDISEEEQIIIQKRVELQKRKVNI